MSKTNRNNAWSNPSEAQPEEIAQMADHLEERAQRPDQMLVNQFVCEVLAPQPDEHLLEAGCGTGVLCRLVTPLTSPHGKVIGLDMSPQFVAIAYKRAVAELLTKRIRFEVAQAEAIPHDSDSFDGAWAARLLLHATDPDAVVRELVRVVRPGGRVVLADWDFGTTVVDHPNHELTRRLLHWRSDHYGGDNWSGRKLFARAQNAGLKNIEVTPVAVVAQNEDAALTQSLWRAANAARDCGAITPLEHDAWEATLKDRIVTGCFFASIVYFIVKGWKGAYLNPRNGLL